MKIAETKLNIGDEFYFMSGSEPKKGKVQGITISYGKVTTSTYSTIDLKEGEYQVKYSFDYHSVEENDTYNSKQEMIEKVFEKLSV